MDELDDILSHKLNTDIYSIIYNRNNADIIEIRYYDCSSKPESRGELINHSIPDDCVVPSIIKFMKKYSPDTTVYLTVDKGETNLISLGFNKRYFNPVLVSTNLFYS